MYGNEIAPRPLLSRLPAWLIHTERGDTGGVLATLGAALAIPVYGLAMTAAAASAPSISALAADYVEVLPYLSRP